MRRGRRLLAAGVGLALAGTTAAAIPSFAASTPTPTPLITTTVVKKVSSWGDYAVVVSVPAPAAAESIDVFVGSQSQRNVAIGPGQGAVLAFSVRHLRRKQFTVRTISPAAPLHVTVAVARQSTNTTPPPVITGSTGATGATGSTGATGATGRTIIGPSSGPYRNLVWSDEFNGPTGTPANPANWSADTTGSCGDGTLSTDQQNPANAALDGSGGLAISAYQLGVSAGASYSSAQLDSNHLFSFSYGELEARIRLPVGSGLCSGFWMVGDSSVAGCFPGCGEIDVMEAISPLPDTIFATLHGPISGSSNTQQWETSVTSATPFAGAYHTYGLIWQPGRLVWTLDGVPYATAARSALPPSAQWVFDGHPFHVLLSLAVGGWPGAPAAAAPFPATMRVDWVRLFT